jgi:adenosylhomocysteinase|tara:strand:+ start:404 stop:1645 length:1242 start_codon:yes stop_codon:yes gene_type:complete
MSKITHKELAEQGKKSYEWARNNMPALVTTINNTAKNFSFNGTKIAVCLHVTKETSVLAMGLKELGADVYLAGANPLSTQDDIAAYLDSEGINVFAWRGQNDKEYQECIDDILKAQPEIIMDDGSDAHITCHEKNEFNELKIIGGTEETTTGVVRLEALEKSGKLKYPIIAVNNAYTKHLFDNRYGTGQSTFDGILRSTALLIAGKKITVCGYGWVGRGIAARAKGLGGIVSVSEINPIRAIEAVMDGFDVKPIIELAKESDIFITATGQKHVIDKNSLKNMKDGAILANAGHFDLEIDVAFLQDITKNVRVIRENLEEYELENGNKLVLIAKGRIANLVAAEGHPPEVMSMSFSNQLLGAVKIKQDHNKLKGLINMPKEIDNKVAKYALDGMKINIDTQTQEQKDYGESYVI